MKRAVATALLAAPLLAVALLFGGCASHGTSEVRTASIQIGRTVYFAPVQGASDEALVPLSQRLSLHAKTRGIGIAAEGTPVGYTLKGYFSVETFQGRTVVHYVWDVLNVSGTRVHRIQGQQAEETPSTGGGWSAVTPATMEAIADSTVDNLADWIAARPG